MLNEAQNIVVISSCLHLLREGTDESRCIKMINYAPYDQCILDNR